MDLGWDSSFSDKCNKTILRYSYFESLSEDPEFFSLISAVLESFYMFVHKRILPSVIR